MHDSERHRSIAADCLSEAYGGRQPGHRNLNLFVAAAWLSLARQGEAIENVIASWNTPKVPERLSFFRVFLDVLDSLFSRLKCFQHFYKIGHLPKLLGHTSNHRVRNP
jgi:hypothetical protein